LKFHTAAQLYVQIPMFPLSELINAMFSVDVISLHFMHHPN